MSNRGEIRHRQYASQIRNFSGLIFGNITPTDIDGIIDFQNKAWIVFELKYKNAELPFGQRLAIERNIDDLSDKKPSIGFIAEHESEPPNDIDAASAIVTEYRYKREWKKDNRKIKLKTAIESFIRNEGISA